MASFGGVFSVDTETCQLKLITLESAISLSLTIVHEPINIAVRLPTGDGPVLSEGLR